MANSSPPSPQASPRAGRFVLQQEGEDGFWAYEPSSLPPHPPLELDGSLAGLIDRANQALGRLDGVTLLAPDPDQFIHTFVRKEAVLSSQIEGTQSSFSDLLLFENDEAVGVPREDAEETANYIAAMEHGLAEVARPGGLPISSRLLRQVHAILLQSGRGANKSPGEFRRTQNWIGGTRPSNARFVPPPWTSVESAMGDLERFIHDQEGENRVLVKAALAHVQLETIHPFLDGNGRLGRLLITLLIAVEGVLKRPLLYLSLYLKQNRDLYYGHLHRVRTDGAWEEWLRFFLEGVIEVAGSTTRTTQRIVALIDTDRQTIHRFGRGAATAFRVHDWAARYLTVRPGRVARELGLTEPPVYNAIARLEEHGILREVTGRQRGKLWVYDQYLELMNEGTEPL